MTKKDFILVAKAICQANNSMVNKYGFNKKDKISMAVADATSEITSKLCVAFFIDNRNFDEDKFIDTCFPTK